MTVRRSVVRGVVLGACWPALSALAQGTATEAPRRVRMGTSGVDVALLVPPQNGPFARATASVVAGVKAAHARDGAGIRVEVIEVDDQADELALIYSELRDRNFSLVLGPITRNGVTALAELGAVAVPTLLLNQPDRDLLLPGRLVVFSLAIESESQQVAQQAFAQTTAKGLNRAPRAAIVMVASPLARRSAIAFRQAWDALGGSAREPVEFSGPRPPRDLRARLGSPAPDVVFLAMNAEQASVMRQSLGSGVAIFGSSLISAGGAASQVRLPELDGVRLLDMPWQIEPDNAAVMAYPKAPAGFNVEMQRLYALGIDAFRIGQQLLAGGAAFELDGVTGRLRYDPAAGPRIERLAVQAEYRNGVPVPAAVP
jgi:outer membrane PBP1 activator LpoA protein